MYKYHIVSRHDGYSVDKADPFAFHAETPPKTGSLVWDLRYQWNDQEWIATRGKHQTLDAPMAIYEVHLGSWRRVPEEQNRPLTYRELAGLARLCTANGLHPRGISSGDGTSFLRLMGL